jgi:hypothetical protein
MAPPAWTAPTVQMSAHPPPHRAAMGGVFLPVCLCNLNFCFGLPPPTFLGGLFGAWGSHWGESFIVWANSLQKWARYSEMGLFKKHTKTHHFLLFPYGERTDKSEKKNVKKGLKPFDDKRSTLRIRTPFLQTVISTGRD